MNKEESKKNQKFIDKRFSKGYMYQKKDSDTLMILFSGLQDGINMPIFEFSSLINDIECSKLFLRDSRHLWYLNGLGNDTWYSLLKLLREKSERYENIICVGASAGGFAAMRYGYSLDNCKKVIAFGPQTILDEDWFKKNGDNRWSNKISYIKKRFDPSFLDLLLYENDTEVDIHYCENNPLDAKHALRMKRSNLIGHSCITHAIGKYLKEKKLLKNIIKREVIC